MKTIYFKKSLLDKDLIVVNCRNWYTTKKGTYCEMGNGVVDFYSCDEYYFWGTK